MNSTLPNFHHRSIVWFLILALVTGCPTVVPPLPSSLPENCDDVTALFAVDDLLDEPQHPCRAWVDDVHGRVVRAGTASGSIYSRNTIFRTGILVSAVHTLGVGWFAPAGQTIDETVFDPTMQTGVARIFIIDPDTGLIDDRANPQFDLYHPTISSDVNGNQFQDILPRQDFFFAVVDGQKLQTTPLVEAPQALSSAATELYDPASITLSDTAVADVVAGQLVLLVGYPGSGTFSGEQAAGVARVLSDTDAEATVELLATVGDVEGDIAYDADAEMIMMGEAQPGMSGGGVFDADGRQVGIIVRASDPLDGIQYVRAVRLTFAVDQLAGALSQLGEDELDTVFPYVDQSLADVITP